MPLRDFFWTDAEAPVLRPLETYTSRSNAGMFFREGKQLLGFADSSVEHVTRLPSFRISSEVREEAVDNVGNKGVA